MRNASSVVPMSFPFKRLPDCISTRIEDKKSSCANIACAFSQSVRTTTVLARAAGADSKTAASNGAQIFLIFLSFYPYNDRKTPDLTFFWKFFDGGGRRAPSVREAAPRTGAEGGLYT